MPFINDELLKEIKFKSLGKNALISDKASIYGAENISIADNVRVDDFCILSAVGGYIELGSHIHISSHSVMIGGGGVTLQDFCTVSSHCSIYSASDDYSGKALMNTTVYPDLLDVNKSPVLLEKYSACGSHAVILPGVTLGEGAVLGACSLAVKSLDQWSIYSGVPAKFLKERKRDLIEKALEMQERWNKEL